MLVNLFFKCSKAFNVGMAVLLMLIYNRVACAQEVDYGADRANKRTILSDGPAVDNTNFNYLNLLDHPANSGVPLGGIGVGNVQFAPDGRFVRIGLNNIHAPISKSKGSFFTLWTKSGGVTNVKRLVKDGGAQFGIEGVSSTTYTGLFPFATLSFNDSLENVQARVKAWSGLTPQDIKNSSLPVIYFDVEVHANHAAEVAVAFAWEDFIGRGIKDPKSLAGLDGQVLARGELMNGEAWPERKHIQTFANDFSGSVFQGVRQFSPDPLIPLKATFQNYVKEVGIIAINDPGSAISVLPAYDINHGDNAWRSFADKGLFEGALPNIKLLSIPDSLDGGSAVSVKTSLKDGEAKTFHFMLVWYFPELKFDEATATPGSYWKGGSGYGRYFHNYFESLNQLIDYGIGNRALIQQHTKEWQAPVLESTLPDWYKFKLINSAYVIYTNMILNKKGDVTVNEGGMGGLAGTMDQRISSHPFYQKFFTQLDRSEMAIFGDAQAFDGSINHFIGHYYGGLGTVGGRVPTENHWMLDNTEGWVIQIAKDYEQTGDIHYLKTYAGRIKDGMKFLKSKMPPGVEIPVGATTYDDFSHPPIYSYGAGMYLASLKAAVVVAEAVNDTTWKSELDSQFEKSQRAMVKMLWNGRFFSYGCEIDGTDRRDNILFTGQLAGQFISRYCGWGDIIPLKMTEASLVSQFKISLSKTPDYYANKVWDINLGHGIDQLGSQCWPFYLESYTAYPAIEAGFVADGLDIMKHIQLVHLRKGLTWSQNLWNPGDITYMTAPVTWFSTDVLAGSGLNAPKGELRLAPLLLNGNALQRLPVFFPKFWGMLTVDPQHKKMSLRIEKAFGNDVLALSSIVIEPAGSATADRQVITIPAFYVNQGAVLELDKWYTRLTGTKVKKAVLPNADRTNFIQVASGQ